MTISSSVGTLFGLSVGTGDPELITLKALRRLQAVPIIAFPAGVNRQPGIAEKIITPWLKAGQKTLALSFPYVQDEAILQQAWEKAAYQVWQFLENGEDVAFACEGDVHFYSTFTYLSQTLSAHYPTAIIKTVPGVCSPLAAVAALGIPLTVRNQKLAILPALYSLAELEEALSWAEVTVLMKVSTVYPQVWQILAKHRLLQQAAIVEWATLPNQIIYRNLQQYPQLNLSYFSLLVVTADSTKLATN